MCIRDRSTGAYRSHVYYSAATRPSCQLTLGKLVLVAKRLLLCFSAAMNWQCLPSFLRDAVCASQEVSSAVTTGHRRQPPVTGQSGMFSIQPTDQLHVRRSVTQHSSRKSHLGLTTATICMLAVDRSLRILKQKLFNSKDVASLQGRGFVKDGTSGNDDSMTCCDISVISHFLGCHRSHLTDGLCYSIAIY